MEQRNDVGDPKKLTKARNRVSFGLQKGAQPADLWILTQQDPWWASNPQNWKIINDRSICGNVITGAMESLYIWSFQFYPPNASRMPWPPLWSAAPAITWVTAIPPDSRFPLLAPQSVLNPVSDPVCQLIFPLLKNVKRLPISAYSENKQNSLYSHKPCVVWTLASLPSPSFAPSWPLASPDPPWHVPAQGHCPFSSLCLKCPLLRYPYGWFPSFARVFIKGQVTEGFWPPCLKLPTPVPSNHFLASFPVVFPP